jgi:PAS domain S-box-containing protein
MGGKNGIDGSAGLGNGPNSERTVENRLIRERARRIEQQLATAQQITHIGSWEWNLASGVVIWSDELYRIYGLEPQSCEITFEGFLGRLHPEDRDRVRGAVEAAVVSKKNFGYPERIVRPDGSIRFLDTLGEPSFGANGEFTGLIGTCRDVTELRARERLEAGVYRILEMIASGQPLSDTLTALVDVIEAESDGMLASILLFDSRKKTLRIAAAPHLPDAYNRAVDGFVSGPRAGSCGTATYLRQPVFVEDISTDPLWADYRYVVTDFGLRACWSTPIFSDDGRVLGTFALYYKEPRSPNQRQLELIQRATHIAGIAIERKQMEEQLQALSARIERVREDERTGIAREIHDELGQGLTGLKMDVAWVERRLAGSESLSKDELGRRLHAMSELIDETINQVRRISAELRPGVLDHLGLLAAIEWQAQEFQKRTAIPCKVSSNLGEQKLGRELSTGVFRIFQEALTNVARHAEAARVTVELHRDGNRIELDVQDDGKGITDDAAKSPTSLGLLGLKERARHLGGDVTISAAKPRGTRVRLMVPIVENDEEVP